MYHFSLPLPPFITSHISIPPFYLSNPWLPFSLLVLICIWTFDDTYVILNISYQVCIMLLVCFHSWALGSKLIGKLFPGDKYLSHSLHSLTICRSLCSTETSWDFPCPFSLVHWYPLFSGQFWEFMLVRTYQCSFWDFEETHSHRKVPDLVTLKIFSLTMLQFQWVLTSMTSTSKEMYPGGRLKVHLSISPLVLGDYPMYTRCTLCFQQLSTVIKKSKCIDTIRWGWYGPDSWACGPSGTWENDIISLFFME